MSIKTLSIQNFRNLSNQSITLNPNFNWFVGPNGSGKTSILEALYFLTTAKSFRTRQSKNIVKSHSDSNDFVLFGELADQSESGVGYVNKIGIQKGDGDKGLIKVNGKKITASSELVLLNPVTLIQPASFDLLYGSPKVRRSFVDWGVFHVEHSFRQAWKQYNICLKQRNSILRAGRIDRLELRFWTEALVVQGELVDSLRKRYLSDYLVILYPLIEYFLQSHVVTDNVELIFRSGWDKTKALGEVLDDYEDKDKDKGFTQYGPHRADLRIMVDKKPAEQWFSRGQQKLLIVAMYLAKISLVQAKLDDRNVTVLLDDLTAELDTDSVERVLFKLSETDSQVIGTSIDSAPFERFKKLGTKRDIGLFHVEHGSITTLSVDQ